MLHSDKMHQHIMSEQETSACLLKADAAFYIFVNF